MESFFMNGEHIFSALVSFAILALGWMQKSHLDERRAVRKEIADSEARQKESLAKAEGRHDGLISALEARQDRMEGNYVREFKAVRDDIAQLQVALVKEISGIRINCALVNHVRRTDSTD